MKINPLLLSKNSSSINRNLPFREHLKSNGLVRNKSNEDKYNNGPAERVSLSGSLHLTQDNQVAFGAKSPKFVQTLAKDFITGKAQDISNASGRFGGSDIFKKVLHSVEKNEAFYEAFCALGVAGVLKPICVIAMPGAEMEDKQMSAVKNSASAITGFLLANLILGPCSEAVNKINKKPAEYIKNEQFLKRLTSEEILPNMKNTLKDSFTSCYKKGLDVCVSPLKAKITIALTPIIVGALFSKRNKAKKEAQKKQMQNPKMPVMNVLKMQNKQLNQVQRGGIK